MEREMGERKKTKRVRKTKCSNQTLNSIVITNNINSYIDTLGHEAPRIICLILINWGLEGAMRDYTQ